ncbi:polycystin-1-like [Mercenaria mercenaria]|uniref:polycystin-1-like n=1 Tax=Mercenaria mercenaria TaxID=6596 RepID=UPI00234E6036|nr:polycystin-1-like [Mercenaria mercenaria]
MHETSECIDLDECAMEENPCGEYEICSNQPGSYYCTCKDGFQRNVDQSDCVDTDECNYDPCPTNSDCINEIGSYMCNCRQGFYKTAHSHCAESKQFWSSIHILGSNDADVHLDHMTPEEIDDMIQKVESVLSSFFARTSYPYYGLKVNSLMEGSIVFNISLYFEMTGSYTAEELTDVFMSNLSYWNQYQLEVMSVIIEDIDECSSPDMNVCSEFASCKNLPGTYECTCLPGYLDISVDRLGSICAVIDNNNQDPINKVRIIQSKLAYPVSSLATMMVAMERGSHVTYVIEYGDGESSTAFSEEVLSFQYRLNIEHEYTSPGNYTLTVNVSNKISSEMVSTSVIIQDILTSLTLDVTDLDPLFSGNIMVNVNTENLYNHVYFQWSFGDGRYILEYIHDFQDTVSVEHIYAIGAFDINVNISNLVSSVTLTRHIISQEVINGVEIMVEKFAIMPGEYLNFIVFAKTGSNLNLELNYGTGEITDVISKNNTKRGSTESVIQKIFNTPDEITVGIKLSNAISEWFDTIGPVFVQYPIKNLKVKINQITPSPPPEVHIEISSQEASFPPTSVTCDIFVHNTWSVTESVPELKKDQPTVVIVSTDGAVFGWIEVTVNCSNMLSYQYMETSTYVQAVIGNALIRADKTSVDIDDTVNFEFFIGKGSNIEYTYWFRLGQNHTGNLYSTLITNKSITDHFTFGQPGKYDVTFIVKNNVSSAIAYETVWVLEKVIGLTVSRNYEQSSKYNILHYGHGEEMNIFPVQRPVIFSASLNSGNNIRYRWNFGDGNETVVNEGTVVHTFKMEGAYTVTVTAFNQLYFENVSLIIVMHEIVLPLKLSNNGPQKSYNIMEFVLELTYSGTETCYVWDMGDGSPLVHLGPEYCMGNESFDSFILIMEKLKTITYSHTYMDEGLYTVSVDAVNEVSSAKISSLAVVNGISCYYPEVSFKGGRQTIEMPIKKLVSDWIVLESSAVINCEATSGPVYNWNIQKVIEGETYLDHFLQPCDLDIAQVDRFEVYFQPRTLDVGLYKISLNVSMIGIQGLYTEEFTYLKIEASPLVAEVKGGSARQVSFDKDFILDGLTGSHDPDSKNDSKSHLNFEWWCRRQNEDFAESSADDIEIVAADIVLNTEDDKKGCFGTGIGRLPNISGLLEFPGFLLMPNTVNIFRLVVKDDTRVAMFEQEVHVVDGHPPDFHISCVQNCKAKVNPSSEFTVQGVCESCHTWDKIDYSWSLAVHSGSDRNPLQLENMTSTDSVSAGLAFKPGVLIGGNVYHLRLDMKVYGYNASFTEHTFETNLPPYGGNCSIEPKTGIALDTLFKIQCQGWMNPGEEQFQGEGLLYRFWTRVRGGSNIQLLYYGPDPFTASLKFPLGRQEMDNKHDIVVRISNAIGEYVETTLETQVNPKPQQDLDEVRALASDDSGLLFEMKQAGQHQEFKQLIVAMASVLNAEPAVSNGKEESLATTTKSTVNQELSAEAEDVKADTSEEKLKNTELRTSIVQHLAETDHVTLDSLQQTALCFKVITEQRDELSTQTQEIAVDAITHMTDEFTKIVEEPSRQTSSDQVLLAAQEMLASVGHVMLAARSETAVRLEELNVKDTEDDVLDSESEDNSVTAANDEDQLADTSDIELEMKKAKELITKAFEVKDRIVETLVKTRTPGQDLTLQTEAFTIHTKREEITKIDKAVLTSLSGTFALPSSEMLLPNESLTSQFIDINVVEFPVNPFLWSDNARFVGSPVVSLDLVDSTGEQIVVRNISEPIVIDILVDSTAVTASHIQAIIPDSEDMQHHRVKIRSNQSDMHIVIHPENITVQLEIYIKYETPPTLLDYDILDILPHEVEDLGNVTNLSKSIVQELAYTIVIPAGVIQEHGIGWWYVGVRKYDLADNSAEEENEEDLSIYYDLEPVPVTFNYTISFVTSGCYFWDESQDTWSTAGCQVSPLSNTKFTRCICNHLTSFGSEFFVPPNRINFETVFVNMEDNLRDNHAVLAMLCTVIVLYVVGIIWAWRQDKKDLQKWGVLPLCDNILTDTYFYEITVFTGLRRGAGTRSNISFVLAGDNTDTGVRQLKDVKGTKTFDRGSINKFILSVDEPLGPLSYLRIWHDNLGTGKLQGWFLSKVVVRELQGQEQVYVFLCNRWLAVEEDDGMVDRLLPVAAHEDLSKFGNIFFTDTRKRLTDSHLWISVFARPNKSNYSRVQRLSCLFSLLMMSMLASAMFYQAEGNAKTGQGYRLGPFKFTTHEMYISVITSLIVLPVNILIDQLFRRSRPKKNIKEQAFSDERPFSALSRLSVRFTDLFRIHSRTQVTPIESNESEKEGESAYRPGTASSLCVPESSHTSHTPPMRRYQPNDTETPIPNVFIKTNEDPPSPSYLEARHHYTPAPALFLKSSLKKTGDFRKKKPQLTLPSTKCLDVQQLNLSSADSPNPSPTNSDLLTPYASSSLENSPIISPRYVEVKSPTESVFSFDSSAEEIENITMKITGQEETTKLFRKVVLPHWCMYIAWCLVFLSSAVSATVTFLYSMEWGKEKSIAWLTSMLLTIVESVSIIQPAKIIVLAVFVAAVLRKTDDEIEKEDSVNNILPVQPEEIASQHTPTRNKRRRKHVAPPDPKKLASVREQRLKEIKMFRIIQEIVFYMFYLIILILVASHNRDPDSYRMKNMLMNVISPRQNLSRINNTKDFWHWMNVILIPNIYLSHDWNGDRIEEDTRLISTQASYRVGPVRLRQHRVNPDKCDPPRRILPYIEKCSFDWSQGHDSTKSYLEGWIPIPVNHTKVRYNDPWAYRSTMEVDGVPYAGEIGIYSGGGYIVDLIGQRENVIRMADLLQLDNWIDKLTRIVFVEFTTYNPNINLFTTALITFEMPTTGVILKRVQIYTFRLFSYLGGFGIFVILCELCSLVCVIYFIGLELKQIKRDGKRHFLSFWNSLQFVTLLTSVTCVVMYLLRHAMTSVAVDKVTKLKDKFYNFQRIAVWDDVFQILLAFAIFASILKLIHILRFNRRMSMLAGTLKLSAKELSAFSLVFGIVLLSFVGSGYLIFGSNERGFRTVIQGFETLLSFSLGSFHFATLVENYRIVGPLYFFFFFTFVMFVLMNMFITILNEAFTVVHKNVIQQKNEYEIVEFICQHFKQWVGFDLDKVIANIKTKYLKGDKQCCTAEVSYTLDDLESRLDLMMASVDAMCKGYLPMEDDLDDYDWLPSNRELE